MVNENPAAPLHLAAEMPYNQISHQASRCPVVAAGANEGNTLSRKAGSYANAGQFRRLHLGSAC